MIYMKILGIHGVMDAPFVTKVSVRIRLDIEPCIQDGAPAEASIERMEKILFM
jgi:hypothetical protein